MLPTKLDHYRLLGRSGLRVSPLCLGAMTFGTEWGWGADRETCQAIFDRYAGAGGNFIDTANFYTNGTSEKWVGEFIGSDRDFFVVGTKYAMKMRDGDPNAGGNGRKNMVQAVEASLRRLSTDAIDLYWVHAWDFTTPVDELMRGLDDLVRSGKVRYLAISDTPAWKVAQLNTYAEQNALTRFVAQQGHYSLLLRDAERDLLPMGRELGVAMLPWAPLGGGVLAGKYTREDMEREQREVAAGAAKRFGSERRVVNLTERKLAVAEAVRAVAQEVGRSPAQVALNWLLQRPGVTSIILGARRVEQLEDNLGCLDFALDDAQCRRLEEASPIKLGFPHDMLASSFVDDMVSGGTVLQREGMYNNWSFRNPM